MTTLFERGAILRAREFIRRRRVRRRLSGLEHRNPILIYQMGKVGSTSIATMLKNQGLDRPVIHVHTLNRDLVREAVARHRAALSRPLDEHLIVSETLAKQYDLSELPCEVITLTREPIGRALSFAFEDWRKKLPTLPDLDVHDCVKAAAGVVNTMLAAGSAHADPSQWFDQELHKVFGVDVFATEYDFQRGYVIIDDRGPRTLVIRMEDLERSLAPAIENFLGIRLTIDSVPVSNHGETKWYSDKYEAVKREFTVEADVLSRITSSRYFRHFYADRMLAVRERYCMQRDSGSELSVSDHVHTVG